MTYTKSINPAFEQVGKRKHLTGYLAELYDGNMLLHSQEYSTTSQAEQALDTIVFDLLTDLHEQGMVDDVPAALEAEMVSSTQLPSWNTPPADPVPDDGPGDPIPGDPGYEYPRCRNCTKSHHTWCCPEIGDLLFGPGGSDLYAAAFELDDQPDLIAEAGILINTLEEMQFDLCADYEAEGRFTPSVMTYHNRLCRVLAKAERRLQRREFAEIGGMDFTPPDTKYAPFGFAA